MKINLIYFLIFVTSFINAQTFYPIEVINNDTTVYGAYFKNKMNVIDDYAVTIYTSESKSSKTILYPNDFSKITALNGEIVLESAIVPNISPNKIIIRKIIESEKVSIYSYGSHRKKRFIGKSGSVLTLLSESKEVNGVDYRLWLYNQLNNVEKNTSEIAAIKYTKQSFYNYISNYDKKTRLLAQEPVANAYNLAVVANFNFNSLNTINRAAFIDNTLYESTNNIALDFSLLNVINLDPLTNRLAILTGFSFYLPQKFEGQAARASSSTINQKNNFKFDLSQISIFVGPRVNLFYKSVGFSPYLTYETRFLWSGKNKFTRFSSENNVSESEITSDIENQAAARYNLGFNILINSRLFVNASYSVNSDAFIPNFDLVAFEIDTFKIGVGINLVN